MNTLICEGRNFALFSEDGKQLAGWDKHDAYEYIVKQCNLHGEFSEVEGVIADGMKKPVKKVRRTKKVVNAPDSNTAEG